MHYFRYILLGMVLIFSSTPITALSVPLGRYFGYATGWVSASFYVTREFVKKELAPFKTHFASFVDYIKQATQKLDALKRTNADTARHQSTNMQLLNTVSEEHKRKQADHSEKLRKLHGEQEQLAKRLALDQERSASQEVDIIAAHAKIIAISESVAKQRTEKAKEDTTLEEQHKQALAEVRVHYSAQNERLDSALKLLAARKNARAAFDADLSKAIEESKKRLGEQKKTSEQIARLETHAQEQETKVAALCAAWGQFKTKQQRKHFYSPLFPVAMAPIIQCHGSAGSNNLPADAASKTSMEEID